jgi:endonuclease III
LRGAIISRRPRGDKSLRSEPDAVSDYRRETATLTMKRTDTPLGGILRTLRAFYGKPAPPAVTEPFEQILLENVAYLPKDAARTEAFAELKRRTGLKPAKILAAPRASLHEVARRGITPAATVEKLLEIAAIAQDEFGGNLSGVLSGPPAEARKALKRFPSIGDPGAEKILLFSGSLPVLALDSNALRVLLRLGFGKEDKSYAKSYRSAQAAAEVDLPKEVAVLIEAHQLLRRHGQELCKTSHPRCDSCPVRAECIYFETMSRPVRAGP